MKDGEKVVVRIADWAEGSKSPVGELVERLGMAGNNDTEMHAILAEYELPYRFDPEIEQAAEAIDGSITAKEIAARRDFRQVTTFTVDPADAKDFDDALSVRRVRDGIWEIGVHIADVTHYVRPQSTIDDEAVERGTSVYLVDRTVPMLPERLSNELCSLRPHETSLCFSAVFTLNENLDILEEWFGRTVIYSDRRFTYAEAQEVIETGRGNYAEEILTLNRLAQALRRQRFKNGAISFDREEVKFKLDETEETAGRLFQGAEGIEPNDRGVHAAGQPPRRGVLRQTQDRQGPHRRTSDGLPRPRLAERGEAGPLPAVHPPLRTYLQGHQGPRRGQGAEQAFRPDQGHDRGERRIDDGRTVDGQGVLHDRQHRPLRTGIPYYTHFTSPIRRYPDMMVHRLLARYLADGKAADKAMLEDLCFRASEREVIAAEAERASIKYKMVEFMKERIGEEFEGHISGLTEWGIYVELDETHIEGMSFLRDIDGDFFQFDEANYQIIGRSTGRRMTLGDAVRIRVKRADLQKRQLDFEVLLDGLRTPAPAEGQGPQVRRSNRRKNR